MLNKQICKKCIIERYSYIVTDRFAIELNIEEQWKTGTIYCGTRMCGDKIKNRYAITLTEYEDCLRPRVNASPPEYCPYRLEHMMTGNEDVK